MTCLTKYIMPILLTFEEVWLKVFLFCGLFCYWGFSLISFFCIWWKWKAEAFDNNCKIVYFVFLTCSLIYCRSYDSEVPTVIFFLEYLIFVSGSLVWPMIKNKHSYERLLCSSSVIRCSAVHSCLQGHSVADFRFERHFKNVVRSMCLLCVSLVLGSQFLY